MFFDMASRATKRLVLMTSFLDASGADSESSIPYRFKASINVSIPFWR
jgi:hypothetical protein